MVESAFGREGGNLVRKVITVNVISCQRDGPIRVFIYCYGLCYGYRDVIHRGHVHRDRGLGAEGASGEGLEAEVAVIVPVAIRG